MDELWKSLIVVAGRIHEVVWAYIPSVQLSGGAILTFLLALELLNEAFDLSTGRGFKLDKRIVSWVFCVAFISLYPQLANALWDSAVALGNQCFTSFENIKVQISQQIKVMGESMLVDVAGGPLTAPSMSQMVTFQISALITGLGLIIIYVLILGAYAALAFVIAIGPIFIPFMLNESTKGLFMRWVSSILSFFIMIPMYGWAMLITSRVFYDAASNAYMQYKGLPGTSHLIASLVGPISCIGIALHVPRIATSLLGGSGGAGGGTMQAGSMVGGAAAGAAMMASGRIAGGAAQAAGAVSSGASSGAPSPHIQASQGGR